MGETTENMNNGREIYKDALKLAWEDFELPPEEVLMLDGLRERFEITDEEHEKMELEVIEMLLGMKESLDIDLNILSGYYKKAIDAHPDWNTGREKYIEIMKKLGREPELPAEPEAEKPPNEETPETESKEKKGEEKEETPKTIKCPKCGKDIKVKKWSFPMRIKCPHCGAKGVLKRPPKN